MTFHKLVLSGGGIKGISFVGAIKILEKYGILDTIDTYLGCSIGAIIALYLNIGFKYSELYQLFTKINFADYQDLQVDHFFTKKGMDSGNKLMKLITAIAKRKGVTPKTTFQELYQLTKKELIIPGSNITTNREKFFSYRQTPNDKVLSAIRISISYPYVFHPVIYQSHTYVDGALLNPFPIKYFGRDCQDVIGILIHDKLHMEDRMNNNETLEDMSFSLLSAMIDRIIDLSVEGMEGKYIQIDIKNIHGMDFKRGEWEKKQIYQRGIIKTQQFLKNYYQQRYIKKKYFHLWKKKTSTSTSTST